MDHFQNRSALPHATPKLSHSPSIPKPSCFTLGSFPGRSEHSSETSSENGAAYIAQRTMNRGNHGYQRGSRGGSRGGRGNRTYSSSSGSSNGHHNRPTLKPSSAPQGHDTPPVQVNQGASQSNSPTTPAKQQTTYNVHSHQINETYKARPSKLKSPKHSTPLALTKPNNRRSGGQQTPERSIMKKDGKHWAYSQEQKVKVLGIPKNCWTKDVYEAMKPWGTVVKINMQTGSSDNNAWVVFR